MLTASPCGTSGRNSTYKQLRNSVAATTRARGVLRQFPSLPIFRPQQSVRLITVRESRLLVVPQQLARHPHGDGAEEHPPHERPCHGEVRARRRAALAGAEPVAIMAAHPVLVRPR